MSSASGTHRLGLGEAEPGASPERPVRAGGTSAGRPRGPRRLGAKLSLPDPPLADAAAGVRLRPWTTAGVDIDALAAAWADPAIAAANGVPQDASPAAATRWLARDAARRAAGRCLDLVVAPLDPSAVRAADHVLRDGLPPVLGEVGLRNIDRVRRRAEVSWWTAADHRGRGVATAATGLLTAWALDPSGGSLAQVWARIDPTNVRSARVAAAAGLEHRGTVAGIDIWSRTIPS